MANKLVVLDADLELEHESKCASTTSHPAPGLEVKSLVCRTNHAFIGIHGIELECSLGIHFTSNFTGWAGSIETILFGACSGGGRSSW